MATVFISYAHEDKEFAVWLTECLRSAGEVPLRDEEFLGRGHVLDAITAAIDTIDCGVFLISRHWLGSDWGQKEAELLDDRDEARGGKTSCIPVYLEPHETLKKRIPAALSQLLGVDCTRVGREEALWLIYCKIKDTAPGPHKEWKEKGQKLAAGAAPLAPVDMPVESRACEAEVLECDRDSEFKLLQRRYAEKQHHLFLVAGAKCEAHGYFVSRIEEKLTGHKPLRPVWRGDRYPASEAVYRERLARLLECTRDADLPRKLRTMLERQNVLLIQPVIDRDYEDEAIVACFTEWLPNLLKDVEPVFRLKCVQPVAWDVPSGIAAAARRWFGSAPPAFLRTENESRADELMKKIEAAAAMPAARVTLKPITDDHVKDFCDLYDLSAGERARLLDRIRQEEAETSAEILEVIDKFMDDRRAKRAVG